MGAIVEGRELGATDPVVTVLLASSAAAALAVLGAAPFAFREEVPLQWIGVAYALASGLMLGVGYLLMSEGLDRSAALAAPGFGLGAVYTFWTQSYARTTDLDTRPGQAPDALHGYKVILQNTLHSASEGVAIGAAMVVSLRLGVFLAFSLAVHNIGEAMGLTATLRRRRMTTGQAAGLCVVTKAPQMLLAIVAFAVSPVLGDWMPALLGFSSGSLVFLLMTELLPASYQRCRNTWIAGLVSFSAGAVVLLEGVLL